MFLEVWCHAQRRVFSWLSTNSYVEFFSSVFFKGTFELLLYVDYQHSQRKSVHSCNNLMLGIIG